jgi:rhodanese-related sulfurtransferase
MSLAKAILFWALCFVVFFVVRRVLALFRGGFTMDDLMALKAAGAKVVDVRTPGEFADGHLENSVNIPLDQFQARMAEIDPGQPVLLCCASGGRSGMAKQILDRAGYAQVHNAGPWTRLK